MIDSVLDFLGTTVSDVVGGGVLWLINLALTLLPMSPFLTLRIDGLPSQALGWLNWFVDVRGMLGLMGAWVAAVLLYMVLTAIIKALNQSGHVKEAITSFIRTLVGGGV